jgi:exodeoxyribonuclease-5
MKWSPQQDHALRLVKTWLNDPYPYQFFLLYGFAGTGKTEIAREIGQQVKGAVFAAYTGKATNVLRKRGCDPSSTIHALIYLHQFDEEHGTFTRTLKSRDELSDVSLIIVDEASMVNAELAQDLLSFGIRILIIADPMQLPPVSGEGHFMQYHPDVMLNEVHRQALNSPILRLATDVRQGKRLWKKGRHDGLVITDGLYSRDGLDFEVVLVGTKETKNHWNRKLRRHRGFLGANETYREPQVDEVVVCLRNDYRLCDEIFNGQQWRVHWVAHDKVVTRQGFTIPILRLSLRNDTGRTEVRGDPRCFNGGTDWVRGLQDFDFGYALTVHKSQGSEWDKVLLVNEARAFQRWSREWLYTAITRASKHLTIIDGY